MTAPKDPRAAIEYRISAAELVAGDFVNTQPGAGDDWQQVLAVYRSADSAGNASPEMAELVRQLGGRYVVVELTDIAPVDAAIYFSNGTAFTVGENEGEDEPVTGVASTTDGSRVYLYTKYELVSTRASN